MKKKKIFILLGHPDTETSVGSFADEYERGAKEADHEVHRINISDLNFDPILHKGYKEIQELEPDLKRVQEEMKWADHYVFLYPNWWCTMPAVLKGMFDRMFLPGFAFNYRKNKKGGNTIFWDKLLSGKSARIVVTTGSHPLLIRIFFGDYTNELSRGILGFAGVSPVRVSVFGPCGDTPPKKKEGWKKKMYSLGRKGI
ncbi:MAG: NAD(P)H-dependent oxidoreductase [Candidatus Pacebacteria bacterium]|jgi:putative NADPH-quinone reductase|nr:NADPH:quinone reductase [bacterium]MDP6527789.1 NAD(P)H-dependent oxidoreductase [Candidatus Paceibacterota bacterium]MDP6659626.1 NAD(P)H-dependent oxidoreductase [Candidatus Paceibacterota bacterium]|tara:strand:- start:54402 stop:54998 length:597 start_codon:yes stop_codon:yes gene_type:complete